MSRGVVFGRWMALHGALVRQVVRGLAPDGVIESWRGAAAESARRGTLPLVLYSQVAWDDVWQRPQELARGLAARRPVLYVSPVQVHRAAGPQRGRWTPVRAEAQGRLLVLAPLRLSGEYKAGAARRLNRAIVERALGPVVAGIPHLFLTNSPFSGHLARAAQPEVTGYDLIDDFCAFDWAHPDGRAQERWLLENCRFAFAGTESLREAYADKFARLTAPLEYLPSGVAFERLTAPQPEPPELRGLPRPRLLYVGSLNDRMDGALIARVAEAFPEGSLILVGPKGRTFSAPPFPGNVRELGLRPHADLPGFYQHCDAGLMPFADNEAARAINPIKTLEYLACGLPTLSTPIPDVERFYRPHVDIARPADWPERLRRMLAEESEKKRSARREFARGRSWEALCERVEAMLREVER
ncbi:MAG: glycosyltransferase [Sumerlaeia bacterium]